ncbi:hypothetical protein OPIT5_13285 [Opitutaceae bacterium TAV5]|nr:hypothetical protein OPIT5_13285 [Opitutaceae bacterium TAV5]
MGILAHEVARASSPCSGRRRFAPSTGRDARATFSANPASITSDYTRREGVASWNFAFFAAFV